MKNRVFTALVTFALIVFTGTLQLFSVGSPPADYKLVNWKWDYSLGFVRRALPGEVLAHVTSDRSAAFVLEASILLFLAILFAYACYASFVAYRRPSALAVIISLSGVLLAPALPSFASSLGRLDQLNYLILIVSVLLIFVGETLAVAFVLSALGAIAVLIHESFVLVQLPLILSVYFLAAPGRSFDVWARLALVGLGPLLAAVAVSRYATPPLSLDDWVAYWASRQPIIPYLSEDQIIANKVQLSTLYGQVAIQLRFIGQHKFGVFSGTVAAISIVYVAWTVFRRVFGRHWLVFLGCLSPLGMFFLGIDFLRWASYVMLNAVIASLALLYLEGSPVLRYPLKFDGPALFLCLALIFLLFPFSTGEEWPRFSPYTYCMYDGLFRHSAIAKHCNSPSANQPSYQ